jgi:hypothetical protein
MSAMNELFDGMAQGSLAHGIIHVLVVLHPRASQAASKA